MHCRTHRNSRETLVSHGPGVFMENENQVTVRDKALTGVLRAVLEAGLPDSYVVELEEIALRKTL